MGLIITRGFPHAASPYPPTVDGVPAGGGRLRLGGGFGWAQGHWSWDPGGPSRAQEPGSLVPGPLRASIFRGAPDLGESRGSGGRGSPQESGSSVAAGPVGCRLPGRGANREYAVAAREELRMSVGRRGVAKGSPWGRRGRPAFLGLRVPRGAHRTRVSVDGPLPGVVVVGVPGGACEDSLRRLGQRLGRAVGGGRCSWRRLELALDSRFRTPAHPPGCRCPCPLAPSPRPRSSLPPPAATSPPSPSLRAQTQRPQSQTDSSDRRRQTDRPALTDTTERVSAAEQTPTGTGRRTEEAHETDTDGLQ